MLKKIIVNTIRFIFAGVFLFSGFVKAIDPLGFTYKMQDYLSSFGSFFEMFSFFAFPAAILLSAIEFLIGFNLLFCLFRKWTTIAAIIFMVVMTPLTLYVALFDPVKDCGCFGDALIIDNWTTFIKNIFLITFAIILYVYRTEMPFVFSKKAQPVATAYAFIFSVGLSIYCYAHLPIIDFRPYKIGTNIPDSMVIPEGAPINVYEYSFIYEKDGIQKEFTLENYPANDTTWRFVDQKSDLIEKGYEPPIHDFSITLQDVGDITQEVLSDTSYTFLLISYKLEKASLSKYKKINQIYDYAQNNGYKFYCLNASLYEDIEDYIQATDAKYPMATTDGTTLKTIIRSNPGLILIKGGTVINKWHYSDLPVFDKPLDQSELGQMPKPVATQRTILVICLLLIPTFVLFGFDRVLRKKKNKK